jgi:hypothetical protein
MDLLSPFLVPRIDSGPYPAALSISQIFANLPGGNLHHLPSPALALVLGKDVDMHARGASGIDDVLASGDGVRKEVEVVDIRRRVLHRWRVLCPLRRAREREGRISDGRDRVELPHPRPPLFRGLFFKLAHRRRAKDVPDDLLLAVLLCARIDKDEPPAAVKVHIWKGVDSPWEVLDGALALCTLACIGRQQAYAREGRRVVEGCGADGQ